MFIRKKIKFFGNKNTVPYDYNHYIMKNIYHWLTISSESFSKKLHDSTSYKGFVFAILFKTIKSDNKGIHLIKNSEVTLILSGLDEIIGHAMRGLREKKVLSIANAEFGIKSAEDDDLKIKFERIMEYESISPVIVKRPKVKGSELVSPYELEEYAKRLAVNAIKKYQYFYDKKYDGELYFDISEPRKERTISVKNGKLTGSMFNFAVETDKDMQKIIYYTGLGQNNSTGGGMLKEVRQCKKMLF